MRYSIQGLIVLLIATILIDASLWFFSKHNRRKNHVGWVNQLSFVSNVILPISFIVVFIAFYFAVKTAQTHHVYNWFGWVMMTYISIYLPKFCWLCWRYALLFKQWIGHKKNVAQADVLDVDTVGVADKNGGQKWWCIVKIVLAVTPFLILMLSSIKGPYPFSVRHQIITYPNLPKAFDGFRIVQISDLHLGSFNADYELLQEMVDLMNAENPDLIVFTGDLVNNFHQETIGWDTIFNQLKAKVGKYSILGNHDYGNYTFWKSLDEMELNAKRIVEANKQLGFTLLRNDNVILNRRGENIGLVGVEYCGATKHLANVGDLQLASVGLETMPFKILLSHDPNHWDTEVVAKTNFDLMLAGHTHGMQLGFEVNGFKWSPAMFKFKNWDGLHQVGQQYLFVNRGIGVLGLPVRVGMRAEISVIELRCGTDQAEKR